jgi:hypothetical protein
MVCNARECPSHPTKEEGEKEELSDEQTVIEE